MSSAVSFGTNVEAQRKRVYYFGTSTIYEGMPVCYDNSTTNVLGVNRYDGSASTTTTEGYQNEGKFLRVENPNADNVSMFAGVVAKGPKVGKVGPGWLEIFVPNGAVVPVRTDSYCLIDQTILAITTGSQELGVPIATDTRPVAIARETIDRGTAGLVLAELCPSRFIYQDSGGTALSVDDADTGTAATVNLINVKFLQATGGCTALKIAAESSAGATSNMTAGGGLAAYLKATVSATVALAVNAVGIQLAITGGTPTEYMAGLHVKVYEDGATMTSCSKVSALSLEFQVADNVQTYRHAWIALQNNGAQTPDALIHATNLATLNAQAFTGNVTIGSTAGDYAIPVYLQSQSGTQLWYIPLVKALA